jgi:hypothetical protein
MNEKVEQVLAALELLAHTKGIGHGQVLDSILEIINVPGEECSDYDALRGIRDALNVFANAILNERVRSGK